MKPLRLVVADDERPARAFLLEALSGFDDVAVVGEAASGREAVEAIESLVPDLALLDLQMPELDGLEVVRAVDQRRLPLIAFVTAYDEYAVRAFELAALDYLLKPVERERLRETIDRAQARLGHDDWREANKRRVQMAIAGYTPGAVPRYLERIPVRQREEIVIVPVEHVASVVAEGELLHLTTVRNERYTLTYRLKDLEARLDPARFVRLSRGTLVNVRMIARFAPMPGGNWVATLHGGAELGVSRAQARLLRDRFLRL